MASLGGVTVAAGAARAALLVLEEIPKETTLIDPAVREFSGGESTSGFWSRTLFLFLGRMFRLGYSGVLRTERLSKLGVEFSARHLFDNLARRWQRTITSKRSNQQHLTANSLLFACCMTWKLPIAAILLPRLLLTGFLFSQPFVLQAVVVAAGQAEQNRQEGGGLVGATLLAFSGAAISRATASHMKSRLITRARGGLIALMFDKTSRLKAPAARKHAAITHMGADLDGIAEGIPLCVEIPMAVLDSGLGMYFLSRFIQESCLSILISLALATVAGILFGRRSTTALKFWNEKIEQRVTKTSRVLSQLAAIKALGLGPKMSAYLQHLRVEETEATRPFRVVRAFAVGAMSLTDLMTPVIVFAVALFSNVFGDKISPQVIYPTLAIVSMVQGPIAELLRAYPAVMAMMGCFERIRQFLCQEEHTDPRLLLTHVPREVTREWPAASDAQVVETRVVQKDPTRVVHFQGVSIAPNGMDKALLSNVNLSITPGSITAVVGSTSSGKTTFLQAILGEVDVLKGLLCVDEMDIALCGQVVWLPNESVLDCIIGSSEYDEEWLLVVVRVCRLVQDLRDLPGGLGYIVGSGGIALSGGQRQRIGIARAVYTRAPMMLFDDIFSALDRSTARAILSDLCGHDGVLRQFGSTVVLSSYLREAIDVADNLVFLNGEGRVLSAPTGAYGEVRSQAMALLENAKVRAEEPLPNNIDSSTQHHSSVAAEMTSRVQRVEDDVRKRGSPKLYMLWIDPVGRLRFLSWSLFVLLLSIAEVVPKIYLRFWIENAPGNRLWFLGFALIPASASIFTFACLYILFVHMSPRAANSVHWKLTQTTINATLDFLASHDAGSILNRYTIDMNQIAKAVPSSIYNTMYVVLTTLIQLGIAFSGATYMTALLPFVVAAVYCIQRIYLFTSRQLRHLTMESQAPLVTSLRETSDGLIYIRGFGWQSQVFARSLKLIDQSQKPYYLLLCSQQMLALVLDLLAALIAGTLVLLTTFIKDSSSENEAGLSFLTIILLGTSFNRVVTQWTAMETVVGSLSRLSSYLDKTPQEPKQYTSPLPPNWPQRGEIEMSNVTAYYRAGGDGSREEVLHDVSLSIQPGQKVGFVGRSGSGKSSLLLTLLGLVDYEGSIVIDGVDMATAPRDELRARIVTISQDQVELDGTIRDNLLPFDTVWGEEERDAGSGKAQQEQGPSTAHKEMVLRETLERLRLWDQLQEKGGLDAVLADVGYSHGEKQMLCVARAVVRRRLTGSRLLLVDEATGGVDLWRDQVVREMMRDYFHGCTILAIAHRQQSIADADVIVEMSRGRVVGVAPRS